MPEPQSPAQPPSQVPTEVIEEIVEHALRAPSVHNTQPWRWRIAPSGLELYADRRYQLPASDPTGRNLVLSCGAALHYAQAAASALGWRPTTRRRPDEADRDLLARIALSPSYPAQRDADSLTLLRERRTDRRRFTAWPVPPDQLHALAQVAHSWGAAAVPVIEVVDRVTLHLLVHRAWARQERQADTFVEQRAWLDHSSQDGVPSAVMGARGAGLSRARFGAAGMRDLDDDDVRDATIVLGGPSDDESSWLRSGEALSALWLHAASSGLSVVPLSQVIEVEETRRELKHGLLYDRTEPHLLVRVGWAPIGRSELTHTPRRSLPEVLDS